MKWRFASCTSTNLFSEFVNAARKTSLQTSTSNPASLRQKKRLGTHRVGNPQHRCPRNNIGRKILRTFSCVQLPFAIVCRMLCPTLCKQCRKRVYKSPKQIRPSNSGQAPQHCLRTKISLGLSKKRKKSLSTVCGPSYEFEAETGNRPCKGFHFLQRLYDSLGEPIKLLNTLFAGTSTLKSKRRRRLPRIVLSQVSLPSLLC